MAMLPSLEIDAGDLIAALKAIAARRDSVDPAARDRIDDFIDDAKTKGAIAVVSSWDSTDFANPVLRCRPSPALVDFLADLESQQGEKE